MDVQFQSTFNVRLRYVLHEVLKYFLGFLILLICDVHSYVQLADAVPDAAADVA